MKTKLLPTMIGAILAGGMTAAAADVTVFGQIDESIVNNSNADGSGNSDTNFVCTTCSIGFKGEEELGNGLKAIFKIDFQYDINERNTGKASVTTTTIGTINAVTNVKDSSSITDRDQWVGLAGNFGQVIFGTMSTTYKSHGALLDPGYRTVAQMRDWGIQSQLHSNAGDEGQGRATNTARYDSPSWNGLKVAATYTLDADESDGDDNDPYGGGISYENGGILVFGDYLTNDSGGDDEAYVLGGKYTYNEFSVFGQYEWDAGLISQISGYAGPLPVSNNKVDNANTWMAGASYGFMGNNTVYGAYGSGDDADNTSTDEGYDSWEVIAMHAMSKRTELYAGYIQFNPDESSVDDTDVWTLGLHHKF
jgi:predicted porin